MFVNVCNNCNKILRNVHKCFNFQGHQFEFCAEFHSVNFCQKKPVQNSPCKSLQIDAHFPWVLLTRIAALSCYPLQSAGIALTIM